MGHSEPPLSAAIATATAPYDPVFIGQHHSIDLIPAACRPGSRAATLAALHDDILHRAYNVFHTRPAASTPSLDRVPDIATGTDFRREYGLDAVRLGLLAAPATANAAELVPLELLESAHRWLASVWRRLDRPPAAPRGALDGAPRTRHAARNADSGDACDPGDPGMLLATVQTMRDHLCRRGRVYAGYAALRELWKATANHQSGQAHAGVADVAPQTEQILLSLVYPFAPTVATVLRQRRGEPTFVQFDHAFIESAFPDHVAVRLSVQRPRTAGSTTTHHPGTWCIEVFRRAHWLADPLQAVTQLAWVQRAGQGLPPRRLEMHVEGVLVQW